MATADVNSVVLVGRLTRDPELRATSGGTSVCSLRLAFSTRTKQDGQWSTRPNYVDVTVWGAHGENVAKYMSKGRQVVVKGRLEWREWKDKDGNKRQSIDVVAEDVQFIGGDKSDGEPARSKSDVPVDDFEPARSSPPARGGGDDGGDIPFAFEEPAEWLLLKTPRHR